MVGRALLGHQLRDRAGGVDVVMWRLGGIGRAGGGERLGGRSQIIVNDDQRDARALADALADGATRACRISNASLIAAPRWVRGLYNYPQQIGQD